MKANRYRLLFLALAIVICDLGEHLGAGRNRPRAVHPLS